MSGQFEVTSDPGNSVPFRVVEAGSPPVGAADAGIVISLNSAESDAMPRGSSLEDVIKAAEADLAKVTQDHRRRRRQRQNESSGGAINTAFTAAKIACSLAVPMFLASVTDTGVEAFIKEKLNIPTTSTEVTDMTVSAIMPLPPTLELSRTPKIVVGSTHDSQTGGDPKAQTVGVVLDVMSVQPNAVIGPRVVHNEELGAVLPEYENVVVISGLNGSGLLGEVAFTPLHSVVNPQRCWWQDDTNVEQLTFEGCYQPGDPNYVGTMSSWSYDGGLHQNTGIAFQAEGIVDLFAHNNYCNLMGIYGGAFRVWDPVQREFSSDPFAVTSPENAGLGLMQTVISELRIDAALSFGVSLNQVLTEDEYQYVLAHPDEVRAQLDRTAAGQGEAAAPFISQGQVETIAASIDPPVIEVLATAPIEDSNMDEIFHSMGEDQTHNPDNLVHCMPATVEVRDELTNRFDRAVLLSQPPWVLPNGLFPSGVVDAERAQTAAQGLENFIDDTRGQD